MSDAEQNKDTQGLLDGRESTYGNVVDNAQRVANMWNGYLGIDTITAADMMMMMALYKAYRFKVTPDYSDNINDVLGYAEIVRQVQEQTGGLIHAETVKEYLEKKDGRKPSSLFDPLHIDPGVCADNADPRIAQQIASDAQARFHKDYDLERKVQLDARKTLTIEQVICEKEGHVPMNVQSDVCGLCGATGLRRLAAEEAEHRAAEEEIKEGRRPPHLRLRPENPEAAQEAVNMESWLRNRCGKPIMNSDRRCRLHIGHNESCMP